MSFTLPTVSNSTGSAIPEGTYVVRLKSLTKEYQEGGPYGDGDRAKWIFAIEQVIDTDDDDPDRLVDEEIWAFSSISMHVKSKMRAFYQALVGRELEEGETPSVSDVVGKLAKASVVPHTKQDGTATTKLGALMIYKKKRRPGTDDDGEIF